MLRGRQSVSRDACGRVAGMLDIPVSSFIILTGAVRSVYMLVHFAPIAMLLPGCVVGSVKKE